MITVFGSINMDLIATVERLPQPGETVAGRSFQTAPGGKGANQALAARRAGAPTRMAGAVGRDAFAEPALALLREAGVDCCDIAAADGPTGIASILVDQGGENVIAVVPGANGALRAEEGEAAVNRLATGDTLLLQFEIAPAAVIAALDAARRRAVRTILNVAPLIDRAADIAPAADVIVANETEFDLLVEARSTNPAEREAAMRAFVDRTGRSIVVTLGAQGVVAVDDGVLIRAAGLVIEPIDTVGAGDTFCGYLAAGLDAGLGLSEALARAAAAGSLACLAAGAQPSIPTADRVDAAMAGSLI